MSRVIGDVGAPESVVAPLVGREAVVEAARGELGNEEAERYWAAVLGPGQPPKHWCGAFALWCLHRAGLAKWQWGIGKGFLCRLRLTRSPEPGDIAYYDRKQHHAVVVEATQHSVVTIDGNSGWPPAVRRHVKPARKKGQYFYSIESLLP